MERSRLTRYAGALLLRARDVGLDAADGPRADAQQRLAGSQLARNRKRGGCLTASATHRAPARRACLGGAHSGPLMHHLHAPAGAGLLVG